MGIGKTLLKVAIGIAIAKGVSALTKGGSASAGPSGGGLGSPGRGTRIDTSGQGGGGGLEDILGQVLGKRSSGAGGAGTGSPWPGGQQADTGASGGGGLGDLLDQISGQKRQAPRASAPKGGLDDLLGQLTGRGTASGTPGRSGGGVGDLLDQVLADKKPGGPMVLPEPQHEEELSAALMLRAVIQAVKCDCDLDEDEKARLMQAMGEADASEVQAVNAELQRPVDVAGLARMVPSGMEPQVYLVSLTAINLDDRAEADYLNQLAGALELSPDQVNAIHDKVGAERLYR